MTVPKRNRPWRHSGDTADLYGLSPSESLAERWTGSLCSSDDGSKSQSRAVGSVLKKFARRNHFGKNFGEFLDSAYDGASTDDVSTGGEAEERCSDNNPVTKDQLSSQQSIPSEQRDSGSDFDAGPKSDTLKKEDTVSRCEKTTSTKRSSLASTEYTASNVTSLVHKGAVATLVAMFEPPWSEDFLSKVLLHNDNNLTLSVDMILSHGSDPPEDLVQCLKEKEGKHNIAIDGRGDSVNTFPKELVHNLGDDVSAITEESSMDFSWKERAVTPNETLSHLPSIQDDEYSIEEEIQRCRQYENGDLLVGKDNTSSDQEVDGALSRSGGTFEECMGVAGIGVVKLELSEGDLLSTRDHHGDNLREGEPGSTNENICNTDEQDTNTIGRLEAKVMRLAGTLGASGEGNVLDKAILISPESESQSDGSTSKAGHAGQNGHESRYGSNIESLKMENAALKSHVKELTERLAALQDAMERMLSTQEHVVNSVLQQRREMETVLADASIARHCEI